MHVGIWGTQYVIDAELSLVSADRIILISGLGACLARKTGYPKVNSLGSYSKISNPEMVILAASSCR